MSAPPRPSAPASAGVTLDAMEVNQARTVKIPAWNERLAKALAPTTTMEVDFNALGTFGNNPENRLKIIQGVASEVALLGGLRSTVPAAEMIVQTIEKLALDGAVRHDMAARILRIRFQCAPAPASNKSIVLTEGYLTYTGAFLAKGGSLSREDLESFFELEFNAKERYLTGKFVAETLPRTQARLLAAIPGGPRINFDVSAALAKCSDPKMRLPTAQTMISYKDKVMAGIDSFARQAEHSVKSTAAKAELALTGATTTELAGEKPTGIAVDSPYCLLPLVAGLEQVVKDSNDVAPLLASQITEIRIVAIPASAEVKRKLTLLDGAGNEVVATGAPVPPPIIGGVILYESCFEDGYRNCFKENEIATFLETHFRCKERGLVGKLLSEGLPALNDRLKVVTGPAVEVEMLWNTIFPSTLEVGDPRLKVAETLCRNGSKFVIAPVINAIESIIEGAGLAGATNPVQAVLMQHIGRIQIHASAEAAKPSLAMAAGSVSPGVLVYTCILTKGSSGYFSTHEAKAALRSLFNIATPASEKSVKAVASRAGEAAGRVADDLSKGIGKALGKFSFGGFGKRK